MAEIHVQPKKRTSNTAWVWIVLVLFLAAVVYYLVSRNNTAAPATTQPTKTSNQLKPQPPKPAVETLYI